MKTSFWVVLVHKEVRKLHSKVGVDIRVFLDWSLLHTRAGHKVQDLTQFVVEVVGLKNKKQVP